MSKARAGKEIHVVADNKIGTLSDVSQWLADKGINIQAVCGYADSDKAHFLFVTSDNKKAIDILKAKQLEVAENEVVIVEMQHKVGTLKDMTKKLKNADVDIIHIYATAYSTPNAPENVVVNSNDNKKAINAING